MFNRSLKNSLVRRYCESAVNLRDFIHYSQGTWANRTTSQCPMSVLLLFPPSMLTFFNVNPECQPIYSSQIASSIPCPSEWCVFPSSFYSSFASMCQFTINVP